MWTLGRGLIFFRHFQHNQGPGTGPKGFTRTCTQTRGSASCSTKKSHKPFVPRPLLHSALGTAIKQRSHFDPCQHELPAMMR